MRYAVWLLCWLGWFNVAHAQAGSGPWPQAVHYQCGAREIFDAGQAANDGWLPAVAAQAPVYYDGRGCWLRVMPLSSDIGGTLDERWLAVGDLNVHRVDIELWSSGGQLIVKGDRLDQHPATIATGRRLLFIPHGNQPGPYYLRYQPVAGSSSIPGMGRTLQVFAADPAQMLHSEQRFDAMSIGSASFMASSALIVGFFALVLGNLSYGLFAVYALSHLFLILSKNGLQFLLPEVGHLLINPHLFQYLVAALSMALSLHFGEFRRHSPRLAWLGYGVALTFLLLIPWHAWDAHPPETLIAVLVPLHFLVLLSGHWRGWRRGVRSSGILLWGMTPIAAFWIIYLWFAVALKVPQPEWIQVGSPFEYLRTLCLPLAFLFALADHALRQQREKDRLAALLSNSRQDLEHRIAQATTELRVKKEEAETATLAKSRFLAAASHDLRQPAHAMGLFVARLAQLPLSPPVRELSGKLESAVRALQDLLDGLLDISRLDTPTKPVQCQPVALHPIFEALNRVVAESAAAKGLRLRIRPSRHWVMSDPVLLQRILLNLVNNAIQYTPHGTVLMTCRSIEQGQKLRIEVRDSGVGVAAEHHELIFKEFYQVGNAERDRRRGMGLGLTIVERSSRLLGHRLGFCSSPGQGSRFHLDLTPASDEAVARARQESTPAQSLPQGSLQGMHILVVEDDAMASEALVTLLCGWGCTVSSARELSGALALVPPAPAQRLPDLILSDFRLPEGQDGIAVIAALRQAAGRPIAACLMSGDLDPGLVQRSREAELVLLSKPVRPAKLRSLLVRQRLLPHS